MGIRRERLSRGQRRGTCCDPWPSESRNSGNEARRLGLSRTAITAWSKTHSDRGPQFSGLACSVMLMTRLHDQLPLLGSHGLKDVEADHARGQSEIYINDISQPPAGDEGEEIAEAPVGSTPSHRLPSRDQPLYSGPLAGFCLRGIANAKGFIDNK